MTTLKTAKDVAPYAHLYWLVMQDRVGLAHPAHFKELEGIIMFYARLPSGERVAVGAMRFDGDHGLRPAYETPFADVEVELDEVNLPSFFREAEPKPCILIDGDEQLWLDFLDILDRAPPPTSSLDLQIGETKRRK